MKTKLVYVGIVLVLTTLVSFAPSAFAVEGGLGRPISGMQITPYAGLVPPEPGLAVLVGETYYDRLHRRRPGCANSWSLSDER